VIQTGESVESLRVLLGAVELVTHLVDWIKVTLVMYEAGLVLQLLCEMLRCSGDIDIPLAAVECLLAITGRKVGFHTVYCK